MNLPIFFTDEKGVRWHRCGYSPTTGEYGGVPQSRRTTYTKDCKNYTTEFLWCNDCFPMFKKQTRKLSAIATEDMFELDGAL